MAGMNVVDDGGCGRSAHLGRLECVRGSSAAERFHLILIWIARPHCTRSDHPNHDGIIKLLFTFLDLSFETSVIHPGSEQKLDQQINVFNFTHPPREQSSEVACSLHNAAVPHELEEATSEHG